MANKVVSTGRIELVDLNDSRQLQLYISSSQPKTQIFNTDNNTYLPNWTTNKPTLTSQLFVAGSSVNVIDKAKSIKWYEDGSINPIVSGGNYTLGAGSKTLTINNNILASADMKIFTCEIIYTDESTGFDIQIKSGIDYVKIVSGKKGDKGETGDGAVVAVLSNDYHGIATDSSGAGGSYTQATSKLHIFIGGTDTSGSWTITATPSSGVTGSLSGQTYSVTNMTVDTGTVTFLAKRSGFADISKVFRVAKSKSGTKGDTGDTGNNAVSYWLIGSSETLIRSAGGAYTPNGFTVTGKIKVGSANPTEYASIWLISESTDGNTYIDKFKSGIPEVSKTYNPQINLHSIRIRMYLADGITLVDEQIVSVAHQGDKGEDGRGAVNAVAWTPDGNTIKNGDRSIKAQLSLYEGSEVTQADNYRWYRENPTKSSAVAGDGWEDLGYGRENLFQKSATIDNYQLGSDNGNIAGISSSIPDAGGAYNKLEFLKSGNVYFYPKMEKPRILGKTYTISLDIKTTRSYGGYWYADELRKFTTLNFPNTNGKWEKFSFTYVQTATETGNKLFGFHGGLVGDVIYLRKIKLEEGSEATPWSPAWEETMLTNDIADIEINNENLFNENDVQIVDGYVGNNSQGAISGSLTYTSGRSTVAVRVEEGETYSISYLEHKIGIRFSFGFYDNTNGNLASDATVGKFDWWEFPKENGKFEGYTAPVGTKYLILYFHNTAYSLTNIPKELKIEKGSKSTPWTPALEDRKSSPLNIADITNSWIYKSYTNPKSSNNYIVDYSIIENLTPKREVIVSDSQELIKANVGEIGYLKTAVYVSQDKEILIGNPYNGNTMAYINSVSVYSQAGWSENGMKVKLRAGWNTIEFMWIERSATDYWDISPTILSQVDEMNGYFALDFGALRGIDGIEGFNTDVMMVSPDAVTNVESFKCIVEYESRIYSDVVIVNDSTDPYGIVLLGTTTFKNGEGESTFTAKLYQDGLEVDENNDSGYTYRWYIYNSDDSKHSTWNTVGYKEGKTITVNADDITNEGRLVCEVDY